MLPVLTALLFERFKLGHLFGTQYGAEFGMSFFMQHFEFFMLLIEDRFDLAFLLTGQIQLLGKPLDAMCLMFFRSRTLSARKCGNSQRKSQNDCEYG